jgi:hypothetical protein
MWQDLTGGKKMTERINTIHKSSSQGLEQVMTGGCPYCKRNAW